MLESSEDFLIVDVRQEYEQPRIESDKVLVSPLNDLESYVNQISKNKKYSL